MKRLREIAWLLSGLFGILDAQTFTGAPSATVPLATIERRAQARGYRVREVRWDAVLQQRWAVLESVAHPELPFLSERTDSGGDLQAAAAVLAAKPTELAVRSGERVTLWRLEENVRIEMGAIAEGNAAVGDRIQLRVTGAGASGDLGWRVSGVVRGPGSVEMER